MKISMRGLLALFVMYVMNAGAVPIYYIYTGTGSGTLNGTPFTNADFNVTAEADTDNIEDLGGGLFSNTHLNTSITISGVGTYAFVTPLRTFVNQGIQVIGFGRVSGGDLYDSGNDATFASWDLSTALPLTTNSGWELLQWSSGVSTSGGNLIFNNESTITGTFEAKLSQPAPQAAPTVPVPFFGPLGSILLVSLFGFFGFRKLKRA